MKTAHLQKIFSDAGISLNGLNAEFLGQLEAAGVPELSDEFRFSMLRAAKNAGISGGLASNALLVATNIANYGEDRNFVTLDGAAGDLVITEDGIRFEPLRGGVNWGAAL